MARRTAPLAEVVALARPIVEGIVWATVATVGPDGKPRSRLMHPVWRWDGEAPIALVSARRTPLKEAHLASHPDVTCFYWDPRHDTVAIDATARWLDRDQLAPAWAAVASTPPPVGFDPALIWPAGPEDPGCAFLQLEAHRVLATRAGDDGLRWRTGAGESSPDRDLTPPGAG